MILKNFVNMVVKNGLRWRSGNLLKSSAFSASEDEFGNKSFPETKCITVEKLDSNVYSVCLNRPTTMNAINMELWKELHLVFDYLDYCADCRAIVLSGAGKNFSSGLDLKDALPKLLEITQNEQLDVGQKALALRHLITLCQNSISSINDCKKPVIAAICGACIGAGTSIVSAADVRYASEDAYFSIKETDLGITADVGILNRINKLVGNDSAVREWTFTGRKFTSAEALEFGFISKRFTNDACIDQAVALAKQIATKSSTTVIGAKLLLNNARDHTVKDSLEYIKLWNQAFLQSDDLIQASNSLLSRKVTASKKT